MTSTLVLILSISFIASLVRSTLGFGESLVAVPLLLFFLSPQIAVPLSVMLSVVIALVVVIQDFSKIHWKRAVYLVIYAFFGIPFGLLILVYGNETLIKTGLGILIIVYALYSLFGKSGFCLRASENPKFILFLCGFLSGVLGGAYGLNGPPLVVYGDFKKWTAEHFRATLQAYFLPASLLGLAGFYLKGLVTVEVTHYFLWALVSAVPAIFLGRYLNRKLRNRPFFKYVYWGLFVIGGALVMNALYFY